MRKKYPTAIKTPGKHRIIPHELKPWWICVECGTEAAYDAFMETDTRIDKCVVEKRNI